MTASTTARKVLVIGVGNTLLQDDGVGVHVTEALRAAAETELEIMDGGTLGLSLLPAVEDAHAVIVVDAVSDTWNPNAIRASLGTIFSLPLATCSAAEALEYLRGQRISILAARVEGATAYDAAWSA